MAPRAALAVLLLVAGCGPMASPSPSVQPGLTLHDVQAEPLEREAAGIAFAFDARSAGELVAQVPSDLDFGDSALVCVYLGERPTTGWGLTLQTATLVPGEPPELRILARETRPRGDARQEVTYPADCATLTRAALPPGVLAVRADDTISDEFIVDGNVTVPQAATAP